jgi:hypothetical protein
MTPQEFQAAFPKLMGWIHRTLAAHEKVARPVTSMSFKRLPLYFSPKQIAAARFVVVDHLPIPPLSSIGLSRFKDFERGEYDGITYLYTYFLKRTGADNESLHFHEMIHVVQWQVLGPEFFLAMYAGGLEKFGYRSSPLEEMAYDAQASFDRGKRFDAEKFVEVKLRSS